MTEDEKKLMEQYGVTSERRTIFFYNGHQYAKLKDALNYAKIDLEREPKTQHKTLIGRLRKFLNI